MNKLTVIVSAYNVGKYIKKCLKSLVNQTLENIEILVVNDGSTDNTEIIVKDFEKKYKNLKLLNKENGGLSSARNYGIKYATGDYIAFVDGDDYLEEVAYKEIMKKLVREKSEIGIFSYKKVYKNKVENVRLNKKLYSGKFLKNVLSKSDEASIVAWNKIFKRDIIIENKIYFENKAYFEDTGFIFRYLYFVKNISIIDIPFYNYVQRRGSITKKLNEIIFSSKKNTIDIIKKFYRELDEYENYKIKIRDMELRMELYILNKVLESHQKYSFPLFWSDIFRTRIPLKHRIGLILIKLKIYERIYYKNRRKNEKGTIYYE